MELVAMDMKQRGLYIARQLSFYGVAFRIEDVSLSHDFIQMYNASVRLVRYCCRLLNAFDAIASLSCIECILLNKIIVNIVMHYHKTPVNL